MGIRRSQVRCICMLHTVLISNGSDDTLAKIVVLELGEFPLITPRTGATGYAGLDSVQTTEEGFNSPVQESPSQHNNTLHRM